MLLSNALLGLLLFAIPSSAFTGGRQTACSAFKLVFLVGATETKKPGNVGGPLSKALASFTPRFTTYSVPYDNRFRFKTSILKGATMTVRYIKKQAKLCPNQRFVLGGYSKGAMVIHSMKLSDHFKKKIAAIVVFVNLNPRSGFNSSQNVASFCNRRDPLCQHSGVNVLAHWTYGKNGGTDIAADFIKMHARISKFIF